MNFMVTESSCCEQIAFTQTSNNDITMVQRKVDANDIMNQTRHLLSLLNMIMQCIIDGCLPELEEIRKLNAFLSLSHSRAYVSLYEPAYRLDCSHMRGHAGKVNYYPYLSYK
jgi:hypothetical protein